MKQHNITRDGKPPIRFVGEQIGSGETDRDHNGNRNRWTTVTIYATAGGKFVVQEEHCTCWQGEHDTAHARSFGTAAEVVSYLRESAVECGREGGELSQPAQDAVEEAATANASFAAAWVETVD